MSLCRQHGMMNDDGTCEWCALAELQAKYDALREAVEDAAQGFEGAAEGHGIDFYAYASDMRAALQRADNETR